MNFKIKDCHTLKIMFYSFGLFQSFMITNIHIKNKNSYTEKNRHFN